MAPEVIGHVLAAGRAGRDGQYQIAENRLILSNAEAVQKQKNKRRRGSGPLVPVDKSMIVHEGHEKRRGHLEWVAKEKPSAESGRRRMHGRLEQANVAQSGRSAVPLDLVKVDLQDFIDRQKTRRLHPAPSSLRQSPKGLAMLSVYGVQGGAELFLSADILHRFDNQPMSIGRNLNWL